MAIQWRAIDASNASSVKVRHGSRVVQLHILHYVYCVVSYIT